MEVYHNGVWGTVCDDRWGVKDAQVVCRQLGFGRVIAKTNRAFYGQGSGAIWLDGVKCNGTELTIENCLHRGWGIHYCKHSEDAGVQCSVSSGNSFYNLHMYNYHYVFVFKPGTHQPQATVPGFLKLLLFMH